jgi:hypothetical protein
MALPYVTDLAICQDRFPLYAAQIASKMGYTMTNAWGFIDGTLQILPDQFLYQEHVHSGYKRICGLKFQNCTTPDGMIAHMYSLTVGHQHNFFMVAETKLCPALVPAAQEMGMHCMVIWLTHNQPICLVVFMVLYRKTLKLTELKFLKQ